MMEIAISEMFAAKHNFPRLDFDTEMIESIA